MSTATPGEHADESDDGLSEDALDQVFAPPSAADFEAFFASQDPGDNVAAIVSELMHDESKRAFEARKQQKSTGGRQTGSYAPPPGRFDHRKRKAPPGHRAVKGGSERKKK